MSVTMIRPNVRKVRSQPNAMREDRVGQALARYQGDALEELVQHRERVITDILEDLRHDCDHHQLNFATLDRMAYLKYLNEKHSR